jgi:hypothetical protein
MKKIICTIFVIIGSYCSAYSQDREVKIPIPEEKVETENTESYVLAHNQKLKEIKFKELQLKTNNKIYMAGFLIFTGGVASIVNSYKKVPNIDLGRAGLVGISLGGLTIATLKIPLK